MKFKTMALLTVFCGLQAGIAFAAEQPAAGSAEKGQAKATTVCIACHGGDGNSVNKEWPNLAGQHPAYIKRQLVAFKTDVRQNPLMTPQAKALSDEEIADLAAYFSTQKLTGNLVTAADKFSAGQKLFRAGDAQKGVPACIGCHGPDGRGNPAAGYASLKGQHATYTAAQLKAYREGTRQTDPNQMMRGVAASMSDAQIEAVAQYIQGLR